ncbi:hypothetical protein [Paraburkholderia saeva]|uniref:Uncharacterized protein n=1 Tax=Paraburkholderia saeva TaxID=2777537 RepID=A0A9N8X194_9BURK|nr:hypothetical protein [Paraburkholderia saeva]CAG4892192.1 hypothetical protein LMG31841_01569 [Paraburkholderia saeva]
MARKALPKQLFYKQAGFLQPSKVTLQDLVSRSVRKLKVTKRNEVITDGSATPSASGAQQWVRLINSPREYAGFIFGVLTLYSPGTHHLVIETAVDEEKDELDVSQLAPPDGKQFTETPLYFGIRDNHVVIIQSKALRVQELEAHLNWLFEYASTMASNQRVELTDAIPEQTRKKLQSAPVKSLTIGAPLISEVAPGKGVAAKSAAAVSKFAKGIGLDVLKGLLSEKEFSALKVDELTEAPDIQVNLQIKVVGHRKDDDSSDKIMKKIMRELRHVEDPSFFKAEVRGMGRMDGSALRVQSFKSVASYDGVLDVSDAYETMRAWLESIIDTGTIRVD